MHYDGMQCDIWFDKHIESTLSTVMVVNNYEIWVDPRRGDGLEVEPMSRNPEGRGSIPRLGSRRSSLISIEHAELLRSTPSLVLCCAWLVTMALHVHCGLGQLSPLPTSGDDKWVAAKHCGRAKRSRISDTHRLRSSLQFRYINNQSLLLLLLFVQEVEQVGWWNCIPMSLQVKFWPRWYQTW